MEILSLSLLQKGLIDRCEAGSWRWKVSLDRGTPLVPDKLRVLRETSHSQALTPKTICKQIA